MQRSREQLSRMSHDELVDRVLEMQDILRAGLDVRDSLHTVLNNFIKGNAEEVELYAGATEASLDAEGVEARKACAAARHAVSKPYGLVK